MVEEPLRGGWKEMKGKRYRFRISKGRANCNGMAVSPW